VDCREDNPQPGLSGGNNPEFGVIRQAVIPFEVRRIE